MTKIILKKVSHRSKNFCTRTATNTPFLNRGHALAFYIFQWKVFKFWSCLSLKSGEIEASNCKLQGIAEVSGSKLLNTGSLQHTRVSWWNGSPLLWLLSEFYPSEFTADGFNQNTDRLTGSHNKAVRDGKKWSSYPSSQHAICICRVHSNSEGKSPTIGFNSVFTTYFTTSY